MYKGAALAIHLGRASVTVRPAVANAQHKVAGEHGGIAITVTGLQANHTSHERMVVGDRAPAHQGWNHGHTRQLGKFDQQIRRIGVDDAAARDDQRAIRPGQHVQCFFNLLARRGRLVHGQGLVRVDVEFNLRHLHIEWQVEQHRAGTARAHQVKSLLKGAGQLARLAHDVRPFGEWLGNRLNVNGLKVFFVQARTRCLASDT